jgi:hypothetical protein
MKPCSCSGTGLVKKSDFSRPCGSGWTYSSIWPSPFPANMDMPGRSASRPWPRHIWTRCLCSIFWKISRRAPQHCFAEAYFLS